jgi:hypothetical protein
VFDTDGQYDEVCKRGKKQVKKRLKQHARQEQIKAGEAVLRRARKSLARKDYTEAIPTLGASLKHFKKGRATERARHVEALHERTQGDQMLLLSDVKLSEWSFDEYVGLRERAAGHFRNYRRCIQMLQTPLPRTEYEGDPQRFQAITNITAIAKMRAFELGQSSLEQACMCLDNYNTAEARRFHREATKSYKWVNHDADAALGELEERIAVVVQTDGATRLVQSIVRMSAGMTRHKLATLTKCIEGLQFFRKEDEAIRWVEQMTAVVNSLKSRNCGAFLADLHDKFEQDSALLIVVEMLHKHQSAYSDRFALTILTFLDRAFDARGMEDIDIKIQKFLSTHFETLIVAVCRSVLANEDHQDVADTGIRLLARTVMEHGHSLMAKAVAQQSIESVLEQGGLRAALRCYGSNGRSERKTDERTLICACSLISKSLKAQNGFDLVKKQDGVGLVVAKMCQCASFARHNVEGLSLVNKVAKLTVAPAALIPIVPILKLVEAAEGGVLEAFANPQIASPSVCLQLHLEASNLLHHLSNSPDGQAVMLKTQAVQVLVKIHKNNPTNAHVLVATTDALNGLLCSREAFRTLVARGAVEAVCASVERGVEAATGDRWDEGFGKSSVLFFSKLGHFKLPFDGMERACAACMCLLDRFPESMAMQVKAGQAIISLAGQEVNVDYFVRSGAIKEFITVLEVYEGKVAVMNVAMEVLAKIVNSEMAVTMMNEAGGTAFLSQALIKHARISDHFISEALLLLAGILRSNMESLELEVSVNFATDLAEADRDAQGRGSKSDPYCLVYWNDQKAGVTVHKDNSSCPVWTDETYVVPLQPGLSGGLLRIEVHDYDEVGVGDLLGQVEVSGSQILLNSAQLENLNHFELMPKENTTEKQLIQGSLGIKIGCEPNVGLSIHICEAADLAQADAGRGESAKSDPYCMVYWNGRFIGKTAPVMNNHDPIWHGEKFDISLKPDHTDTTLRIECRDKDRGSVGELLGQVEIKGEELMMMQMKGRIEFPLQRKKYTNEPMQIKGRLGLTLRFVSPYPVIVAMSSNLTDPDIQENGSIALRCLATSGRSVTDIIKAGAPHALVQAYQLHQKDTREILNENGQVESVVEKTDEEKGHSKKACQECVKTMAILLKNGILPLELMMEYTSQLHPESVVGFIHALLENRAYDETELIHLGAVEAVCCVMAMHSSNNKIQSLAIDTIREFTNDSPQNIRQVLVAGSEECKSQMKVVELTIKHGQGLESADGGGYGKAARSDPYCVVKWNDRIVGQTRVIQDDNNPKWEHETFQLRYPPGLLGSQLRLEVRDSDPGCLGDLLGQVILRGEDLISLPSLEKTLFELTRNRESAEKQLVQGKLGIISNMYLKGEKEFLEINVVECQDLANADEGKTRTSKSDPYVLCYWNGELVGQTAVIEDNMNPMWLPNYGYKSEVFTMELPPPPDMTNLVIEVRDFDEEGKVGDLLGQVMLEGQEIVELLHTREGETLELPLKENPQTEEHQFVAGSLGFSLQVVDAPRCLVNAHEKYAERYSGFVEMDADMGLTKRAVETADLLVSSAEAITNLSTVAEGVAKLEQIGAVKPMLDVLLKHPGLNGHSRQLVKCFKNVTRDSKMRSLEVDVCEAHGLAKADSGADKSDPYVLVYWNGKKIGETEMISDDHDPVWEDEKFVISLPPDLSACSLRMEVRDFDIDQTNGMGTMLGQIEVDGSELLAMLGPGKHVEPLQRSKGGNELQMVAGSLGFRLMTIEIPGSEVLVHSCTTEAILAVLAANEEDMELEEDAFALLKVLTDSTEKVDRVFEGDPPILTIVRNAQNKFSHSMAAIPAISELVLLLMRSKKHRDKIQENVLNKTLKLFSEYPSNTKNSLFVLDLIVLIRQTPGLHSFTLDNIGIASVAKAMRCHKGSSVEHLLLTTKCCAALCHLLEEDEDIENLSRNKGIELAMSALRRRADEENSDSRDVQLLCEALGALQRISAFPSGVRELLAADALQTVVVELGRVYAKTEPCIPKLCKNAVGLIGNILKNKQGQLLVEQDGQTKKDLAEVLDKVHGGSINQAWDDEALATQLGELTTCLSRR